MHHYILKVENRESRHWNMQLEVWKDKFFSKMGTQWKYQNP